MTRHTIVLIVTLTCLTLTLAACSGGASSSNNANAVNITVTATEFKFDSATITVAPGQMVNLTINNKGSIEHTWVLKAANVKITVQPGKSETKTFTAPTTPGTYPIDCDVAGHKEAGMVGQLIVK